MILGRAILVEPLQKEPPLEESLKFQPPHIYNTKQGWTIYLSMHSRLKAGRFRRKTLQELSISESDQNVS